MNPSKALRRTVALVAILGCTIAQGPHTGAQGQGAVAEPARWPAASSPATLMDPRTEAMVDALLKQLTVEEKVGQVIQADISSVKPEDLKTYPLGSVQAGGNSSPGNNERSPASAWVALLREFRAANTAYWGNRTAIPIMFGIDAVHGHSNIVGATIFPHNVGLGAAHDPALVRRIGEITATEMAATGADWTYAPTVTVCP